MRPWRFILLALFLLLALSPHFSHAGEGQGLLLSGTAYYSREYVNNHRGDFDELDMEANYPVQGVHEVTFNIYRAGRLEDGGYDCSRGDWNDGDIDAELVHTIVQDLEFSEGTVEISGTTRSTREYFLVGAGRFSASLKLDNEILLSFSNQSAGVPGDDVNIEERMSTLCVGMTIGDDEELQPRVQYSPVPFARISEYAIALKTNPGQPQIIESQLSLDRTPSTEEVTDASLLITSGPYVEDSTTEFPYLMALQVNIPPERPKDPPTITDVLTVRADGQMSLYGDLILEGDNRVFNLGGGSLVVDEATLSSVELSYLNGATSNLQTQINSLIAGTGPLGTDIDTDEIRDGMVFSIDIANDTVAAADIAANAVGTSEITDDAVTTNDLAATLTFAAGDIVNLSAATGDGKGLRLPQGTTDSPVNSGNVEGLIYWDGDDNILKIFDGGVWANITGGGSNPFGATIDTSEITDETIAAIDLAPSAVGTSEISDGSVASADIAANTIVADDLATDAIGAAEIPDTLCFDVHSAEINPTETANNVDYINLIDNTFSTTEANEDQFMVPINVMANSFIATTNIAPENGAGLQSWMVILRVNSVDTALTCTISEAATSCGAAGISAMIAAGSKVDILVRTSALPPATTSALNAAFCFGQ